MFGAHAMSDGGGTAPPGQQLFTTVGDTSFKVPSGLSTMSLVLVGKGGDAGTASDGSGFYGHGGDLRWINNLPVTAGETLTLRINGDGTWLLRGSAVLLVARSGARTVASTPFGAGPYGGTVGGGNGGDGYNGGGGAGGYSGNGGNSTSTTYDTSAAKGQGGAGAGGYALGGGGGVGLNGQGADGAAPPNNSSSYTGGGGGSGGVAGGSSGLGFGNTGGNYGGGASQSQYGGTSYGGAGGGRAIWGKGRLFPSTNTGDM